MTAGALDLDRLRLPPGLSTAAKPKPPRFVRSDFLRGPIPWPWLAQAMKLRGKALALALVLWREAGIANTMTIPVRPARLRECGILPDAARRALRSLERAGLVTVERPPGCCPQVTILFEGQKDLKKVSVQN